MQIKALASVAQLVGASSSNQKVVDLIPGDGTFLGTGFDPGPGLGVYDPQSRCVWEATNQCFSLTLIFLSLSLPLSLPLSSKAMKKMSLEEDKNENKFFTIFNI